MLSLKNPEISKSGSSWWTPSSICPLQISKSSPVCCRPASPNFTHLLVRLAPSIWLSTPGIHEQGKLFSPKGAADEMLQGVIRPQGSSPGVDAAEAAGSCSLSILLLGRRGTES